MELFPLGPLAIFQKIALSARLASLASLAALQVGNAETHTQLVDLVLAGVHANVILKDTCTGTCKRIVAVHGSLQETKDIC
jgi:hypothetical protein